MQKITIAPFCTSGGSGLSGTPGTIAGLETDATILDGLHVSDSAADNEESRVAEWEYACRAGTTTPFYMENSPSAEEANYYGHYPYMIEDNYFSQGNLEVKPGEYRQTTVAVGSFSSNPLGLYDMHGNVGEWTWDIYGAYPETEQTDPVGAASGTRRVYRGGGWNDFAKNMRCAYRAMMGQDKGSFIIGIRLVRNAVPGSGSVESAGPQASIPMPIASFLEEYDFSGKTIILFCSHGGGRFGQSLTAIAKLAPDSGMGEGLSIHYSGGSTLKDDISQWLETNGIE